MCGFVEIVVFVDKVCWLFFKEDLINEFIWGFVVEEFFVDEFIWFDINVVLVGLIVFGFVKLIVVKCNL